ncbi:nucleolar protein 58 [Eurytemora carolleeae]|uniref:nucleolar protein 58 n=1 Tax=Eurytemora carolleeae TaxID=1294199 RepID=UPI000C782A86|nr:nucleolar protein 58 [Eurytemora carolleeae]|eukprot:XP_023334948.1 nucleolar protein 58-like [Eurytemora affinis]
MLVLFETPAGYAIFKLLDEKKLQQSDNLYEDFETVDSAKNVVKLKKFQKFEDTTEALAATTAAVEGKMSKSLKKMLKKIIAEDAHESLAVADAKLGNSIQDKMNLNCVFDSKVSELMRCIRSQASGLITGVADKDMAAMELGLAHSLSRYKLKFSPDKIDTMIVQAVNLLDDLDKELNNYIMRCREWYGWHFPEMGKIITDNLAYVRTVELMGMRENAKSIDLSDVLPEEVEEKVKEAAEISMGTEISEEDITNIKHLCEQVVEIQNYRAQLYDYLKNRMMAIAPNLTILVGELVGARLISHAGSLINLAKHPASTVQILGAEKALFKALKTKHDTPKYGLIYHAQLVGSASTKLKGKVSRMLAAKASLACRVDALGDESTTDLGMEHRAKVESRIRQLESGNTTRISGTARQSAKFDKYENKSEVLAYKAAADVTLPRKREVEDEDEEQKPKPKKIKVEDVEAEPEKKKKKKKDKEREKEEPDMEVEVKEEEGEKKKKKKKKSKTEGDE